MPNKPIKIYAEDVEDKALEQFNSAMELDCSLKGALMPDAHTGYSLPIGGVVATDKMIFPSWVGYDIGCGMCAIKTEYNPDEVRKNSDEIFNKIYKHVPVGPNHNEKPVESVTIMGGTPSLVKKFEEEGRRQLGTLGGGNHFIEIGQDDLGKVWIVIHSGSRNFGWRTARDYMCLASPDGKPREGHYGFEEDSDLGIQYIEDLNFCLEFALENRLTIARRVDNILSSHMGGWSDFSNYINRNHNHAIKSGDMWIHRKGATHAEDGMLGVIPGESKTGSFIVMGKGNPDSLFSSSHGAGRRLGRRAAKETLDMDQFSSEMSGIKALVTKDTLEEAPMAYKDIFRVLELQADLIRVLGHVHPIICVKAP